MYQGFQLQGFNKSFFEEQPKRFEDYVKAGTEILEKDQDKINKNIEQYLLADGVLNGEAMEGDWFPKINADVFLSHSHRDEDLVFALAGWLKEEMGLWAFVDSGVWGYADRLLEQVDDKYCKTDDKKYYSYPKRNVSTSHVHMMLSVALTKMIDQCECFMFVNTPESIVFSEAVREEKTLSPWIYAELLESRVIRRNPPNRDFLQHGQRGLFAEDSALKIEYPAPVDHLVPLTDEHLNEWRGSRAKETAALDWLYKKHLRRTER